MPNQPLPSFPVVWSQVQDLAKRLKEAEDLLSVAIANGSKNHGRSDKRLAAIEAAIKPPATLKHPLHCCQECGEFRGHGHVCKPANTAAVIAPPAPLVEEWGMPMCGFENLSNYECILTCYLNKGHMGDHAFRSAGQVSAGIAAKQGESVEASGNTGKQRPRIVCLCGSTRFKGQFDEWNYRETMAGKIVLSVGFVKETHGTTEVHGEGVGATPDQKIALDELHKRKIDLADEVLILNVGGYIGSSTRSELNYALAHGKVVRYLESGNTVASECQHDWENVGKIQDGLGAMSKCRKCKRMELTGNTVRADALIDAQVSADLKAAGIDMGPAKAKLHAMVEDARARVAPPSPRKAAMDRLVEALTDYADDDVTFTAFTKKYGTNDNDVGVFLREAAIALAAMPEDSREQALEIEMRVLDGALIREVKEHNESKARIAALEKEKKQLEFDNANVGDYADRMKAENEFLLNKVRRLEEENATSKESYEACIKALRELKEEYQKENAELKGKHAFELRSYVELHERIAELWKKEKDELKATAGHQCGERCRKIEAAAKEVQQEKYGSYHGPNCVCPLCVALKLPKPATPNLPATADSSLTAGKMDKFESLMKELRSNTDCRTKREVADVIGRILAEPDPETPKPVAREVKDWPGKDGGNVREGDRWMWNHMERWVKDGKVCDKLFTDGQITVPYFFDGSRNDECTDIRLASTEPKPSPDILKAAEGKVGAK